MWMISDSVWVATVTPLDNWQWMFSLCPQTHSKKKKYMLSLCLVIMKAACFYLRACASILSEACSTFSPFSTQSFHSKGHIMTTQLYMLASRRPFSLKRPNNSYGVYSSCDICIWSLLSLTLTMLCGWKLNKTIKKKKTYFNLVKKQTMDSHSTKTKAMKTLFKNTVQNLDMKMSKNYL